MNDSQTQKIANDTQNNDENDIFKNMVNYFELTPKTLDIKIPYKLNDALDYLKNISLGDFSSELKEIIKIEENKNNFYDEQDFSIDNISFITSKLSDNDKTDYILLKDLKKENYILPPGYSNDREKLEKGISITI